MNKYNPLRCGSYIPLPEECFKWAILSALISWKYKKTDNKHLERPEQCETYEEEFDLNFDGIEFPVEPSQVPKFEKENDLSINVHVLKLEKQEYKVLPLHVHSQKKENHIHLLLIESAYENEDDDLMPEDLDNFKNSVVSKFKRQKLLFKEPEYHYVWIKICHH